MANFGSQRVGVYDTYALSDRSKTCQTASPNERLGGIFEYTFSGFDFKFDSVSQMPDFATIAGIVGTITGTVALIISIKSYTRVSAMKALDLRLELGKAFSNLDVVLSGLGGYLDYVHQSHLRVLAATGRNQSGEMTLFEADFADDKARLRGLLGSQPKRESNCERYSPNELETTLTTVHAFHVQVADLRAKYKGLLDSDDGRRKEIREEHRQ